MCLFLAFSAVLPVTLSGAAFSAGQVKCANKLKDSKDKNPRIYVLGELHEQDLQKHFIVPACEGKVVLGIEHYNSSKIVDLYDIYCPFKEKIFGFEDEGLYAMFLLFRENIMLSQYSEQNDGDAFKKYQNEVINLLWMSDGLEAAWKIRRDTITKELSDTEEIKMAGFIDKFLEFKNDKKFKRRVSMLRSFEKPWNKLAQGYGTWASMLENKKAFIAIVKQLSLSLSSYSVVDGLECHDAYIKDMSDQELGLYCYFKIRNARDKAIYANILDNYCDSMEKDASLPFVITVGAGHVANIAEMLEKDMDDKVNIEIVLSKTASDYTIETLGKDKVSILKELYPAYSDDDFVKGLFLELEGNIKFLSSSDVKVLDEEQISYSLVKGL
jgi:hypothetical protein